MKSRRSQRENGDDSRPGALPIDLMPQNPGEDMFSGEDWTLIAASLHLSARELSVAVLMFEGKTRFQIARKLKCAPGTVRVYIDRLFNADFRGGKSTDGLTRAGRVFACFCVST